MTFEPIRIGNTVVRRTKTSTTATTATTYEIKNETSPHLINSLSKIITSTTAVNATNVLTLRDYIKKTRHATELHVALSLVKDFGKQMQALTASGWSIACIGVDDVLVITHRTHDQFTHDSINDADSTLGEADMDPQFLVLNDHLLFEVEADGTLNIDHALPKPKQAFMSPELKQLLHGPPVMPMQLHFKTIFYSAAQLIIYFLLNVDEIPEDPEYLNPIKHTSMYWFLLRCLNPVPADRKYVYI